MGASKMNQWLRKLVGVVLVCTLSGCTSQKSEDVAPTRNTFTPGADSWMIQYRVDSLGKMLVYITPSKAKFESNSLGTTYVILDSEKKVFIFNDKRKLLYSADVDLWRKERSKFLEQVDESLKNNVGSTDLKDFVPSGRHATIQGEKSAEYVDTVHVHAKNGDDFTEKVQVWISSEIKAPSELLRLIKPRANGLPEDAVPLRMVVEHKGKTETLLEADKCLRMSVPDSVFEIPIGYKIVNSEQAVLGSLEQVKPAPAAPAATPAKDAPPANSVATPKAAAPDKTKSAASTKPANQTAQTSKTSKKP